MQRRGFRSKYKNCAVRGTANKTAPELEHCGLHLKQIGLFINTFINTKNHGSHTSMTYKLETTAKYRKS